MAKVQNAVVIDHFEPDNKDISCAVQFKEASKYRDSGESTYDWQAVQDLTSPKRFSGNQVAIESEYLESIHACANTYLSTPAESLQFCTS